MVLSTFFITAISPRGGSAGASVTVTGSGFGVTAGTVTFDPLGTAVLATVTAWNNNSITFTIPTLISQLLDGFVTVFFQTADANDGASLPFWIPAAVPSTNAIDYQQPDFEAGTPDESVDDPREIQACDVNRLLDRIKATTSGDVPSSRRVNTTAPLQGGGDLTADRTLSLQNAAANTVLAGPTSGPPAAPAYRAIVQGDLPSYPSRALTDKGKSVASPTTGNGANTALTVAGAPRPGSYLAVLVNGYQASVGNLTTGSDCFFSRDGGSTAVAEGAIQNGDTLFWNGTTAKFDLATTDRIDFDYLS